MSSTIKKPFEGGDRSQPRITKLSDSYQSFQVQKLNSDNKIYLQQIESLKNYQVEIKKIEELIKNYKGKAEKYLVDLKNKVVSFENEKIKYQTILKDFQNKANSQNQKINNLKNLYIQRIKQRIAISKDLNLKLLNNLEMDDRKSESNDLFKWILLLFYKQPTSKYYWVNFKENIFEDDEKGFDFRQRLGKIPPTQTKQQEKILTEKILQKREHLANHQDFVTAKTEVLSLLKIGELYLDGFTAFKQIKQKETQILKTKDQRIQKQQLFKKAQNKRNQLEERVKINEKYIKSLQEIETRLTKKQKIYSDIQKNGLSLLEQFKNIQNGIFVAVKSNQQIQKEDNPKCTIF